MMRSDDNRKPEPALPARADHRLVSDLVRHRFSITRDIRFVVELFRCIFRTDLNCPDRRERLLRERAADVVLDKDLRLESRFVLKAQRPRVSARELARQYGMEELRFYVNRTRCEIDKCRGWELTPAELLDIARQAR